MKQEKFMLKQTQIEFLSRYKQYGFQDRSSVVRLALQQLQEKLEWEALEKSADLYAAIYAKDTELQALTETALDRWPE